MPDDFFLKEKKERSKKTICIQSESHVIGSVGYKKVALPKTNKQTKNSAEMIQSEQTTGPQLTAVWDTVRPHTQKAYSGQC